MHEVTVRVGMRADLPQVLKLIKELAEFERAPHEVINTIDMMEQDGFGPNPIYGFFVAERKNLIVGLALYYYRYSTWKGKRLYLEDIIITETERGQGIGKLLFNRTLKKTLEEKCSGMTWQALDWNELALNFYKKYQPKLDSEWITYSLEKDHIEELVIGILDH